MINKKLLSFDRAALRYVWANVAFQWLGLVCNIIFVRAVARLVGGSFCGQPDRCRTAAEYPALPWHSTAALCLYYAGFRHERSGLAGRQAHPAQQDL